MNQSSDDDRGLPSLGKKFSLVQLLTVFLCANQIGVMLQNQAVVLNIFSNLLCVLIQDAEQGRGEDDTLLSIFAGVSESKAYDMDIELDDEDGTLVYEVEFKSGNMEYDYEIDAASGTILKHEAELDD